MSSWVAIILDSCWRTEDEFTLIDNCNRLLHISLNPSAAATYSSISTTSAFSPVNHAIQIMLGHEQEITSFCWTLDKAVLLSSSEDGTIKVGSIFGMTKIGMESATQFIYS